MKCTQNWMNKRSICWHTHSRVPPTRDGFHLFTFLSFKRTNYFLNCNLIHFRAKCWRQVIPLILCFWAFDQLLLETEWFIRGNITPISTKRAHFVPSGTAFFCCSLLLILFIGSAVKPGPAVWEALGGSNHGLGILWPLSFWVWLPHNALARKNEAGSLNLGKINAKSNCLLDPGKLDRSLTLIFCFFICHSALAGGPSLLRVCILSVVNNNKTTLVHPGGYCSPFCHVDYPVTLSAVDLFSYNPR